MSKAFSTICLVLRYYLVYCFIYCLFFGRYCLDAAIYDNLQDLEEQDFEQ
jgi:hypothetical protein